MQTYDTPASKMDDQQKAFAAALRNPAERACKAASDVLQGFLAVLESLVPDLGWRPAGA